MISSHYRVASVIAAAALFAYPAIVLAAWSGEPYTPGETLNPECAPTDENCTVAIGWSAGTGTTTTNNLVGIGTTTPDSLFTIDDTSNSGVASLHVINESSDGWPSVDAFYAPNTPLDQHSASLRFGMADATNRMAHIDFFNGSDMARMTFGFYGNDDLMALTQAGDFGIGTTNPQSKLDVNGDVRISGEGSRLYFPDGSSMFTAATPGEGISDWNDLNFETGGQMNFITGDGESTSSKMVIKNSGLVGIGTSDPTSLLDIVTQNTGQNTLLTLQSNFQDNDQGGNILFRDTNVALGDGAARIRSVAYDYGVAGLAFDANNGYALQEVFRITPNGRVGIGTADPLATLDVAGSAILSGSGNYLNFGDTQGLLGYGLRDSGGTVQFKNDGGDWTDIGGGDISPWTTSGSDISFTGGNVGIGTDSPNGKLVVSSDAQENFADALDIEAASTPSEKIQFGIDNSSGYGYINTLNWGVSNTAVPLILNQTGGSVGIGTTNPSHTLDVNGDINYTGTLYQNGSPFFGSQWTTSGDDITYSTGNVGIGTSSPSENLTVSGSDATFGLQNTNDTMYSYLKNTWDTLYLGLQQGGTYYNRFAVNGTSGAIGSVTNTDGPPEFQNVLDNGSGLAYFLGGNVGIGTDNPNYLEHLVSTGDNGAFLGISNQGSSDGDRQLRIGFGQGQGYASIQGTSQNVADDVDLILQEGGANVGIGTTAPQAKLDVAGSAILSGSDNYLNFGDTAGESGYGIRMSGGHMQYRNTDGDWTDIGSGGGGPSGPLHLLASTSPSALGYNSVGDHAASLAVRGQYAYTANGDGTMTIVNITDPTNPVTVSTLSGVGSGGSEAPEDVAVAGNYAYLASEDDGALYIADVSNPAAPFVVGSLSYAQAFGGSAPDHIRVSGKYAYIDDEDIGLVVVDISDPAHPTEAALYRVPSVESLDIEGGQAYVTDTYNNSLHVLDIAHISDGIRQEGVVSLPGQPYGVAARGTYVYVADNGNDTLDIVDVSNPSSPSVVGSAIIELGTPEYVEVSGSYAYVSTDNGVSVVDISNPASPSEIGSTLVGTTIEELQIQGDYAYALFQGEGGVITPIDLGGSFIQNLEAGHIKADAVDIQKGLSADSGSFRGGLSVGSGGILSGGGVSGGLGSFSSVGIGTSTPRAALEVIGNTDKTVSIRSAATSSAAAVYDLAASGYYLFAAEDTAVQTLHNDGGGAFSSVGFLSSVGDVYSLASNGNELYTGDGWYLYVYDITDPGSPGRIGAAYTGGQVRSVAYDAGKVYAVNDANELEIFDVSGINIDNPGDPSLLGYAYTNAHPERIEVVGGYAYVVEDSGDMEIFDVRDPSSPVLAGNYSPGDLLSGFAIRSGYAVVTRNSSDGKSLETLDLSDPTTPVPAGFADIGSSAATTTVTGYGSSVYVSADDRFYAIDVSNIFSPSVVATLTPYQSGVAIASDDAGTIFLAEDGALESFEVQDADISALFENGRVGIGTENPLSALDVAGSAILSGDSNYLNFGASAGEGGYGIRDNSGTLQFKNANGTWTDIGSGSGLLVATSTTAALASATSTDSTTDVSGQTSQPLGIAFGDSGRKMYVSDNNSHYVYEYSLSTAWDPSSATYDASADTGHYVNALAFSADGLHVYITTEGNSVAQLDLSVAWDITTETDNGVTADVSGQMSTAYGATLSSDGTKLYVADPDSASVYEYTLGSAWDLSSASYSGTSLDLSGTIEPGSYVDDVQLSADGERLIASVYIESGPGPGGWIGLYQYTLGTPWDLSSATYDAQSLTVPIVGWTPMFALAPDSSKLYIAQWEGDSPASVSEYALDSGSFASLDRSLIISGSNNYLNFGDTRGAGGYGIRDLDGVLQFKNAGGGWADVASTSVPLLAPLTAALTDATTTGESFDVSAQLSDPNYVTFADSGHKMYVSGAFFDGVIYGYTLARAYDPSSASYDSNFSPDAPIAGFAFNADGTRAYLSFGDSDIRQFDLGTPWDISTAVYNSVLLDDSDQISTTGDFTFSSDGTKIYISDYTSGILYEYTLGSAWDLSSASYGNSSLPVSNIMEAYLLNTRFSADGTRMYVVAGLPEQPLTLREFTLGTPWDLSTAHYEDTSFTLLNANSSYVALSGDGSRFDDIEGTSIVEYSLGETGAALDGTLLLSGDFNYLNFGDIAGPGGYGIRDNGGTLQFKNSSGQWTDFGSSVWVDDGSGNISYDAGNVSFGNGSFLYASSTGQTSIDDLSVGALTFPSDAGVVSWIDLPVSDASSEGTIESYSASIGGESVLTVYGEADGSGGVQNLGIGIGTTTPAAALDVNGSVVLESLPSTGGLLTLCVDGSGQIVTDTEACTGSTERIKHAIEPLSISGTSTLMQITPSSFIYNADASSTVHWGFIAEDLASTSVTFIDQFDKAGQPLTINPVAVLATAVKAIQELTGEINALATKLTTKQVQTDQLCVGNTCVTEAQLKALLQSANVQSAGSGVTPDPDATGTSTQDTNVDTSQATSSADVPSDDPSPAASSTEDSSSVTRSSTDDQSSASSSQADSSDPASN